MTELAARLTRLRGEKSRKQVAADLGISQSALAMYENGHRVPKDEIKVRIASYYGRPVGEIFFTHSRHVM